MKKKLFSIMAIAAIAVTSCKKEEVLDSNQLGEATITGNIYADLDQTNDVNAAGLYTQGSNPESVEGIVVSVTIDTEIWDQSPDNNYDYPEKTYTATTDASGNYTLTIPTTDKPNNVSLKFNYLYTTQKKHTTDGSELIEDVRVGGNTETVSIYSGAAVVVAHEANIATVYAATNEYGSAKIRVKFRADVDYGPNSVAFYDDLTGSSIIGKTVEFTYENYTAPDGNNFNNTVFVGTIVIDPTNNTQALVEVDVPTRPTGQNDVRIRGNFSDFQGTVKKDDGSGNEITQNAIYNLGNVYTNMFYLADGEIETYGGIITIGTTEN